MGGGLSDDERKSLLVPCGCGHTINDHGGLTGCWTCADSGGDCVVSFEVLLAERLEQIIAARVTAALNEAADRVQRMGHGDEPLNKQARAVYGTDHYEKAARTVRATSP